MITSVYLNWYQVGIDGEPNAVNVLVSYKFGVMEAKYINGKFYSPNNWVDEIPEVTHFAYLPDKVK
jgi:hypothetical protein